MLRSSYNRSSQAAHHPNTTDTLLPTLPHGTVSILPSEPHQAAAHTAATALRRRAGAQRRCRANPQHPHRRLPVRTLKTKPSFSVRRDQTRACGFPYAPRRRAELPAGDSAAAGTLLVVRPPYTPEQPGAAVRALDRARHRQALATSHQTKQEHAAAQNTRIASAGMRHRVCLQGFSNIAHSATGRQRLELHQVSLHETSKRTLCGAHQRTHAVGPDRGILPTAVCPIVTVW